ncbi:hypothetical protein JCM10213v2_008776 [Rhodosporidiobolus nylandii]
MDTPSPSPTIGAVFVGLIFAIWLSSSAVHLAGSYLKRTADPWQWRVAVVFLTAVNTAHTGILCHSLYEYLVDHFGDAAYLSTAEWDLVAHYAIFVFTSLLVQLYFGLRISTLYSGRKRAFFLAPIVVFALAQLGFGIAATYSTAHLPVSLYEADLRQDLGWQTMASGICAVLCDVIIFIAVFKDMRTPRYTVKAEGVVEVLSRLFIETNFVTTIVAILSLAFYLAWDAQGHQSGAFAIVTPKLYLISMLASVNRGAESVSSGGLLSRSGGGKHDSSLSDFFRGTPISRLAGVTVSRIGKPSPTQGFGTPIADRYAAAGGAVSSEEPGWLRRTFQGPTDQLDVPVPLTNRPVTAQSFSIYEQYYHDPEGEKDGAAGGAGVSSALEPHAQTPTPRRAHFGQEITGEDASVAIGGGRGEDAAAKGPQGSGVLAGRQPVRYGYL